MLIIQARKQHNADILSPFACAVQKLFPDKNSHVHNHRAVSGKGLVRVREGVQILRREVVGVDNPAGDCGSAVHALTGDSAPGPQA